jgi:multidrug efflux pump subunit AcrA (membrane-fusion protein)
LESGDKVFLARRQWVIRPGDMVDVEFLHEKTEPALYVPMQAVLPSESGKGSVFVVEQQQARKIEVLLGRREGELQAIEASQPENQDRIAPGTQLIVHGVQYLIDGEPVRIIEGEGSSL